MSKHSPLTRKLIADGLRPRTARRTNRGQLRLMAAADGYVMVRYPGAMPFVMPEADWLSLPEWDAAA